MGGTTADEPVREHDRLGRLQLVAPSRRRLRRRPGVGRPTGHGPRTSVTARALEPAAPGRRPSSGRRCRRRHAHKLVRDAWGFGRDENLRMEDLMREKYRGIRPAAGYPACPDHAEKQTLFDLLDAEKKAGIKLTESFAMHPGASVSGLYFSHPEAKYFGVGKIGRDQVEDYAGRSGEPVAAVEKRLATNLGYEPGK